MPLIPAGPRLWGSYFATPSWCVCCVCWFATGEATSTIFHQNGDHLPTGIHVIHLNLETPVQADCALGWQEIIAGVGFLALLAGSPSDSRCHTGHTVGVQWHIQTGASHGRVPRRVRMPLEALNGGLF